MVPREPGVIGTRPHLKPCLGADKEPVPAALQSLANDLLRNPIRIHIRRVDQVHTRVERHVDLAPRALEIRLTDSPELAPTAKPHRPQRQLRDTQSRATQLPILHAFTSRS